jgi:hypothetical protein
VQEVCEAVAAQTGADPEISLVDAQVLMMKVLGELPGDDDVERVRARLEESGITLSAERESSTAHGAGLAPTSESRPVRGGRDGSSRSRNMSPRTAGAARQGGRSVEVSTPFPASVYAARLDRARALTAEAASTPSSSGPVLT